MTFIVFKRLSSHQRPFWGLYSSTFGVFVEEKNKTIRDGLISSINMESSLSVFFFKSQFYNFTLRDMWLIWERKDSTCIIMMSVFLADRKYNW